MNPPLQPPTPINTASYPSEFQQPLREKSENFVGREFIFAAINEFLHKYDRGYFTLIGAPGSGKSAILAKYVTENPHVIYYNAQLKGKNRADQFLITICNQLLDYLRATTRDCPYTSLPDNATEGSWFLSLLLQKISDNLEPDQQLIVAIDALDAIDPNSQPASSNLFYLPRYLPEKVCFLLTRRPFVRERSRLLIEAPSQVLNLQNYPEQNREDVQAYIRQCLTPLASSLKLRLAKGGTTEESLAKGGTTEESGERISPPFLTRALVRRLGGDLKESWERLIQQLTAQSENNFMYSPQILAAITEGFYSEPFQFDELPPGLEAYYQSHWQRMTGKGLSSVELGVLHSLVTPLPSPKDGISAETIARAINEDEYDVEAVLENWIEFLQQQQIGQETRYSLYHSSFCNWLQKQLNFIPPVNPPSSPRDRDNSPY